MLRPLLRSLVPAALTSALALALPLHAQTLSEDDIESLSQYIANLN